MNGELAQLVALTTHGNAVLAGEKPARPFYPGNSTTQYCQPISFVIVESATSGSTRAMPVASSPDEWFVYLSSNGAKGIQIMNQAHDDPGLPAHVRVAFVGGGSSALAVRRAGGLDFWLARWEVGDRGAHENRIWNVSYGMVRHTTGPVAAPQDLTTAEASLKSALEQIRTFARANDVEGFAKVFDRALQTLKGDVHEAPYHGDLLPDGFRSPAARRLLDSSQVAWVFGGMGSWNDMAFDAETGAEYDKVTTALYSAVVRAIAAAANATDVRTG